MPKQWVLAAVLFAVLLSGCTNLGGSTPQAPAVARPETGKAAVTGKLTNSTNDQPLPDTIVRLAEVQRQAGDGAYILDDGQSPGATSDAAGNFTFSNVEAREYVVIVGDVGSGRYTVIADDAGKPKVWDVKADNVLDLGTLEIDLGT